ncbi:MAG: class I SAM-dependent methyltransferase [Myxococcales bacterium]
MRAGRPSRTAEWVALTRAYATLDAAQDQICDDPIALSYLNPALRAWVHAMRLPPARSLAQRVLRLSPFTGGGLYVPARVAFIDQALLRRLDKGLDQLVLLGAGFDSRAERLAGDLAGVTVYEVDFPATQARKLAMRPAAPGVRYLALDLTSQPFGPALQQAGFDPSRRSAFIWEGVLYYLERASAASVLDSIRALLAPGGGLMLDYLLDGPALRGPLLATALAFLGALGEPVLTRFRDEEVAPFFADHGFEVADRAETAELERRYFRGRNAGIRLPPIYGCLDLTAR